MEFRSAYFFNVIIISHFVDEQNSELALKVSNPGSLVLNFDIMGLTP